MNGTKLSALPSRKTLKEIAEDIGVNENDLSRITIYSGIQRRGGLYEEPEFLKMYIRYLHEKLFGFAAVQSATTEPPRISTPRARLINRTKRPRPITPWSGATRSA